MSYDSTRALELLRMGTQNPGATFRDGQEEAIRHMVDGRGRLLVVQATGWGKSAVYFIATKLLREKGAGPVLLISPRLALMRNQIAAAERMGVQAFTINSENEDRWEDVETAEERCFRHPAHFARTTREPIFSYSDSGADRGTYFHTGR